MNEMTRLVRSWNESQAAGTPAVLATVVRVEGSNYRRPGARMLVVLDSPSTGSVSGGCLESDVMEHARDVMRTGRPCLLHYDTALDSDPVFGTGMGCGGEVDILLEPAGSPSVRLLMDFLEACVSTRQAFALGTVSGVAGDVQCAPGDRVLCTAPGGEVSGIHDLPLRELIRRELSSVLHSRRSYPKRIASSDGAADVLCEYVNPPTALLILGAGDDAVPLCQFATGLGWQVTVADHRPARVSVQRFPEASLVAGHPDELRARLDLDLFDAAVIMTHNYQIDNSLLAWLGPSRIGYIGLLGAAQRAERILAELSARGLACTPTQWQRVHAPVGLDLKAEGAAEIALAVLSEIKLKLSGASGVSLSSRRGRILPQAAVESEHVG